MTALLVVAGAVVGAPLRYLTDRFVQSRHETTFPWGTFTVNVLGCLVLGALAGAGTALPAPLLTMLGTGFCGALTTYSTFSYETVRLVELRAWFHAVATVLAGIVAGLGAVLIGYTAVSALV